MALENVVLKKINKVAKEHYSFKFTKSFFPTKINGEIVNFDLTREGNKFIGTASVEGEILTKTLEIKSDHYLADVTLSFSKKINTSLSHTLNAHIEDPRKILPLLPAFERNEFYVSGANESDRKILVTKTKMESSEHFKAIQVSSFGDQYFAAAILKEGSLAPDLSFFQDQKEVVLNLNHKFDENISVKEVKFGLFVGPKDVALLSEVSPTLGSIVNFTYLGFIAKPILKGLDFLFGIFHNYGIAVIVLTLLIRLAIMPLAVTSYKSMKRMQVIQPELKKIKEKYKDQPQVINQKTMQVMKDNKVNPLGGCLPMLLQLPIFFAFYRALSESVDLYQAPFMGWIDDLSKMDPYFIFPILSMVGMVVHQMVTPTQMDKMQQRMMMVMPLIFGLLFVTLPSALTLYMAVSTWFGIAQHAIFLRDKKATA